MKKFLLCYLAIAAPLAAENLFDNADMNTAGGWKGSRKIDKEEGVTPENRVLIIEAKKRGPVTFSQEVPTKGVKDLKIKLRYKTKNYSGRGLELRGFRQDRSSTFYNKDLTADGQWHEATWDFGQVTGSNKIEFSFSVLEGEGEVLFDDISVEVAK